MDLKFVFREELMIELLCMFELKMSSCTSVFKVARSIFSVVKLDDATSMTYCGTNNPK